MVALSESERTRIRAREMGFVFQEFNLIPTLTALENVMLAGDYAGIDGKRARQASREALALVGLEDRGGHRPSELSGGEQQRVAIARALVNRPSLDPRGRADRQPRLGALPRRSWPILRRYNRERGQTFVLVTHDSDVGAACDRIVRMRDGKIREDTATWKIPTTAHPAIEPALTGASRHAWEPEQGPRV